MFVACAPLSSEYYNSIFIPNSLCFSQIKNFKMDIQKHSFIKQMCNAFYVWS